MYRRSYYRGRSNKWSNETLCFNEAVTVPLDGGVSFPAQNPDNHNHPGIVVVPASDVLGNRKCKNFTVKVTSTGNDDTIIGALVYVPEGTEASPLQTAGRQQSLYEPNQNVIATFVIPSSTDRNADGVVTNQFAPTTVTVSNRLARNLSSGDYIVLVFSSPNGLTAGTGTENPNPIAPVTISGTVNYAIKY